MAVREMAYRSYFSAHPEQYQLAQRLDEAFDITYGALYGQLAMWLAEPKPHAKERFGLDQEVLVIYSGHRRTDARVLTAIENISRNPDFKYRVDKVLALVVHSGDRAETWSLFKKQADWIIVPFHCADILDRNRGSLFVRSEIAKATGLIDLFGQSSPIKADKYLFGRDGLIQNLIVRSTNRQESSGLFGLRKTGKTSVLFAVQRRLGERSVLVEYFDCQNPGIHATRWWQVLQNIIERCCVDLQAQHKRTYRPHIPYDQANAGMRFSADIKGILSAGNLQHVLLMFDEIEYITPELSGALGQHWDIDFLPFWQTIRATHQEVLGALTFILAGVNPASVERTHFGEAQNPIFQLAIPQYLTPLNVDDIRNMVRSIGRYAGLSFTEDIYPYLYETYGGHPYLIRIACSEVWKESDVLNPNLRTQVPVRRFMEKDPDIKARLSQPIKDILLSLVWWYPDEYDLLRIIADGDEGFIEHYRLDSPTTMFHFTSYGLLKPHGNQLSIRDLGEFLRKHGDQYKREISPFTRGDMPPEFLPEVPDLDVLGKLFRMRCDVEIGLRKAIIMYLGIHHGWNSNKMAKGIMEALPVRRDRGNPTDLAIGRTPQEVVNDLYTHDLKEIIARNWKLFGGLFDNDKERFRMNMDTINQARRIDAHTKPAKQHEIDNFHNSYSWVAAKLQRIPGSL